MTEQEPFPRLATFHFSGRLQQSWREGRLHPEWAAAYPGIFDEDDVRNAASQAKDGYHFLEWLAAILLHHTKGTLSLVEKYAYQASHKRKSEIVEKLCSPDAAQFIFSRGKEKVVQCPDLLVYRPDFSDWFFCEVKGPGDRLRPEQAELFTELQKVSGKQVHLVEFVETDA